MFYTDIDEEELQIISNIIEENRVPIFLKNLLFGSFVGAIVFNFKRISSYFINMILYPPGVGKVRIKDYKKTKVALVSSEQGDLTVPVVKCPSFELNMGFFSEGVVFQEGLQTIDEFTRFNVGFPKSKILKNIGAYWITDIERPCHFDGKKIIYGFIISHLDGLIYLFKVTDNKVIDYKKIINDYEESISVYSTSSTTECSTEEGECFTVEGECSTEEGKCFTVEEKRSTLEEGFCTQNGDCCNQQESVSPSTEKAIVVDKEFIEEL